MEGKFKPSTSVLCDDVRREDNGKYILLGVYTGGINFDAPFPVRKRGLFVFSLGQVSSKRIEMAFRVRHKNSGEVALNGEVKLEMRSNVNPELADGRNLPIELAFPISPIEFHLGGKYAAQYKDGSGRWKTLLEFDVTGREPA